MDQSSAFSSPPDAHTQLKGAAVQKLREPPSHRDPLMDNAAMLENAMSIARPGGWMVQVFLAHEALPFIVFTQQLSINFKKST